MLQGVEDADLPTYLYTYRALRLASGIGGAWSQVVLVKGGPDIAVTSKVLGMPHQTLWSWVKLSDKGQLKGAGDKPVSVEQMELARLRAELARVKMERAPLQVTA